VQRLLTPTKTRFWEVQWSPSLRYNISPAISVHGVTTNKITASVTHGCDTFSLTGYHANY
jgi:hypothetical protein